MRSRTFLQTETLGLAMVCGKIAPISTFEMPDLAIQRSVAVAVVEISITPLGTTTPGVSRYVAGCLAVLRDSDLKHQLTPMGTIIEGEIDEILGVIRRMHEAPFSAGAVRVSTLIKIDDRRDRADHSMAGKLRSVEEKL